MIRSPAPIPTNSAATADVAAAATITPYSAEPKVRAKRTNENAWTMALPHMVASDETQRLSGLFTFKDKEVCERRIVGIALVERKGIGNALR